MLLVCGFVIPADEEPEFTAPSGGHWNCSPRHPGAWAAMPPRAVDDPQRWVLTVRFGSVDAYRRALPRSRCASRCGRCWPRRWPTSPRRSRCWSRR